MALTIETTETLAEVAENLYVAGKILRKMLARMPPETQKAMLVEIGTRVTWAKGFRKWARRVRDDQPEQLKLLLKGVGLEKQMVIRQPGKHPKKPKVSKKPKPKGS